MCSLNVIGWGCFVTRLDCATNGMVRPTNRGGLFHDRDGLFHDRDGLFHNREEASCKADEKSPSQQREVARTKNLALKSRMLCGG